MLTSSPPPCAPVPVATGGDVLDFQAYLKPLRRWSGGYRNTFPKLDAVGRVLCWRARVDKRTNLGQFKTEFQAALAVARWYAGEFGPGWPRMVGLSLSSRVKVGQPLVGGGCRCYVRLAGERWMLAPDGRLHPGDARWSAAVVHRAGRAAVQAFADGWIRRHYGDQAALIRRASRSAGDREPLPATVVVAADPGDWPTLRGRGARATKGIVSGSGPKRAD